jgi:predicted phosphate transport protein (TIGR00153 family)
MSISTFFQKLVPTDKKFFPLFEDISKLGVEASLAQHEIFEHDDPGKQKDLFKQIKDIENHSDEVAQKIFDELDKSFVPPFDREDIHELTNSLDLIIDLINGVAQRIRQYRPKEFPSEFKDFAKIISKGCEQSNLAISELKSLKKPQKILKACQKIVDLEKEADDLYHSTISNIFKKEKDAIELIKQKEILENMENVADCTKDVSDILKTIILKMS